MSVIRPYTQSDRDSCLRIFDSNVPGYFDASERHDFSAFLDHLALIWPFQVIEADQRVVACGGLFIASDGVSAGLCWGMVEQGRHRHGFGTMLTEARIAAARDTPGVSVLKLDTSQHTQQFYARFGFKVQAIVPDGYGPGLDRWDMILVLS